MQTGTKISGAFHAGALVFAMFGGAFFRADPTESVQVADVSLVSSEQFADLMSRAPAPQATESAKVNEPEPVQEAPTPELVEPEPVVEPEPEPEIAMVAPEPTPAPRVDKQAAPKPEPSAKEAETPQPEAAPDPDATKQAEPKKEQAPKEASTQIVTEPEKPSEFAPQSSDVPRTRPKNMKERVAKTKTPEPVEKPKEPKQEAKPETQTAEKPKQVAEPTDNTADEIAKALAQAQSETSQSQSAAAVGPPLTGSEKEGLVLAVQKCWNVPVGIQDADDLAVTIAVDMTPDGRLASSPKLIEPTGAPSGSIKQAFEAGRRALIRCAPYDLPQDKYEQWRQIEVVFNPERMVVK